MLSGLAFALAAAEVSSRVIRDHGRAPAQASASPATPAEDLKAKTSVPLGGVGLKVLLGETFKFGDSDAFYFDLSYKGDSLYTKGTAPAQYQANSDPLGLDKEAFQFTIRRGRSEVGGNLLKSFDTERLNDLLPKFPRNVRVAVGIDSQVDVDKQTDYHGGLEYSPLVLSRRVNPNATAEAFLVPGIVYDTHTFTDDRVRQAFEANLRGRLGFGSGYVVSDQQRKDFEAVAKQLRSTTLAQARDLLDKLKAKKKKERTSVDADTIAAIAEFTGADDQDWNKYVADNWTDIAKTDVPRSQPTFSAWVDYEDWASFTDQTISRRLNGVLAANLDFSLDRAHPDRTFLRLSYELGHTRAEPDKRVNALGIMVGYSF